LVRSTPTAPEKGPLKRRKAGTKNPAFFLARVLLRKELMIRDEFIKQATMQFAASLLLMGTYDIAKARKLAYELAATFDWKEKTK
jgi:hypothetical protein